VSIIILNDRYTAISDEFQQVSWFLDYYRGNQQRKHVVIETVGSSAEVLLPGNPTGRFGLRKEKQKS